MKVSIIVPAYNTENVIIRCLQSLFYQDMPHEDYEVIIIDDGSTDDTYKIVRRFIEGKTIFKLFRQKNQRQGTARNVGLQYACGEYIWFVDSDDYIKENSLGYIYNYAKKENLDLLCFNNYILNSSIIFLNNQNLIRRSKKNRNFYYRNYTGRYLIKSKKVYLYPWCCLIKREFINNCNIRFRENLSYEDNEFMLRLYYYASRVMYIREAFYYNDISQPSTTRTHSSRPIFDLIKITQFMIEFINSIDNDSKIKKYLCYYTVMTYNTALDRLVDQKSNTINNFLDKTKQLKRPIILAMFRSHNIKYVVEGMMYSLSPMLYIKLLRLFK